MPGWWSTGRWATAGSTSSIRPGWKSCARTSSSSGAERSNRSRPSSNAHTRSVLGTDITADTVVRDSIVVEAPIGVAFDVFTTDFGAWFPREYNLMADPIAERTFEPRAGGEIVDRSE